MKKVLAIIFSAILLVSLAPAAVFADTGLPEGVNGYHFTLNIIGVQNPKTADMDSDGGSTIFVNLEGRSKIYLDEFVEYEEGVNFKDAFTVLDKNATDSEGAVFQLPAPGYDAYVINDMDPEDPEYPSTTWSVFARPLGRPGGYAEIQTCAELVDESALMGMLPNALIREIRNATREGGELGQIYASVEQVGQEVTTRPHGKSTFTNVTAELTSIVFMVWVDLNGNENEDEGEIYFVRVPIFDAMLNGEYWEYDNFNLKHLQLRFYEVPTSLVTADGIIMDPGFEPNLDPEFPE